MKTWVILSSSYPWLSPLVEGGSSSSLFFLEKVSLNLTRNCHHGAVKPAPLYEVWQEMSSSPVSAW